MASHVTSRKATTGMQPTHPLSRLPSITQRGAKALF